MSTFFVCCKNKNDNIHKNEVQNIGFGIPINFKYRLAANITEYHKESEYILQLLLQSFVVQGVIRGKVQYRIWNLLQFSK